MKAIRRWIGAAVACLTVSAFAQGPVYDDRSGVLTLPTVQVGTATYTDVTLLNLGSYTFRLLAATEQVPPGPAEVSYESASGILSIPTVAVGASTYVNVTLANTGGWTFALRTAYALGSLTVSAPTLLPREGDIMQITAVTRAPGGNVIPNVSVTWSSSDANIAPITANGLLQTWATGTVSVTAAAGSVSSTQMLTIMPKMKVNVTVGAKELVFHYTTDHCEELDVPDGIPRLVRAEDGSLVLFAGNAPRAFVSRGADFASLRRDCSRPVLVSSDRHTPESYENWEWIWAVYREGSHWYAFISNEFHDTVASSCLVGDPSPANPCWYNSTTLAVSTDGARTFTKPLAPAHVITPPPYAWVPPMPSTPTSSIFPGKYFEGYQPPLNVFRALDGYYYASHWFTPSKSEPDNMWSCAVRTDRLDDASSWRAWDGSGFNLRLTSPYVTENPGPLCGRLWSPLGDTFNTYLGSYMQVFMGTQQIEGKIVCGVFFQLSANLFVWSPPQLIVETIDGRCQTDSQNPRLLEPVNVMYPVLIDHVDSTVNFERPGRTPYLYYVRFNRNPADTLYWLDRDVVRVPLTFTRLN